MIGTYEQPQASGSLTQILIANETDWGVKHASPAVKSLPIVPGETADLNLALYQSRVINPHRSRNRSVRGTQLPGGTIPFDLAHIGQAEFLYHLLGYRVSTTGANPYTHTLRKWGGATSRLAGPWPPGFTLEKGFLDLQTQKFFQFYGCRINSMLLNFNVNAVAQGSVDFLARSMTPSPTDASIFAADSPTDIGTADPFTSVQISVYEGSSLALLGTCESLSLQMTNNMSSALVLGSNYRANIKPGDFVVTGGGSFLFGDEVLYEKAINGTDSKIQITCSNGTYSIDFLMPDVELLPNGSVPKINTPGGLSIPISFEALYDSVTQTEITVTIINNQSSIIA